MNIPATNFIGSFLIKVSQGIDEVLHGLRNIDVEKANAFYLIE